MSFTNRPTVKILAYVLPKQGPTVKMKLNPMLEDYIFLPNLSHSMT
jgi:hypothetical protein